METTTLPIDALIPDAQNANLGTDRGRAALSYSLETFGAGRSVLVDRNKKLISGNKTAEAAKAQGFERVLLVPTDGKTLVAVQRTDLDLDDPEARGLAFADNRVGELDLLWSPEMIQQGIADGVDLSKLFNDGELEALMHGLSDPVAPADFAEYDEEIETEYCCPRCSYRWSGKPS